MISVTVTKNNRTTDSLYQWDAGQVLEILGLSLPVAPEIHFARRTMRAAVVCQSTMTSAGVVRVEIPDSLLEKPGDLTAYVCLKENGVFSTLHRFKIPVIAREEPADEDGREANA
jgi:hypothetical protein